MEEKEIIHVRLAYIYHNWCSMSLFLVRKANPDGLLSKLFQTNEDLDSTLDMILKMLTVVGAFALVIGMLIAFHDDIADKAGMALMSAIGMISLAMRDMFPSGGNGKGNGKS